MAARFKKGQVTGQGLNSCSSPQLQMFNVTEVTGTFWLPFTIKVHQVALFGPLDFNPLVFFLIVGDHCQSCWWRWEFKLIRTQSVSVCACVCVCLGGGISHTQRPLFLLFVSLLSHAHSRILKSPHMRWTWSLPPFVSCVTGHSLPSPHDSAFPRTLTSCIHPVSMTTKPRMGKASVIRQTCQKLLPKEWRREPNQLSPSFFSQRLVRCLPSDRAACFPDSSSQSHMPLESSLQKTQRKCSWVNWWGVETQDWYYTATQCQRPDIRSKAVSAQCFPYFF